MAGFDTQYGTYIMPSEFISDYTGYIYNEETVSQVIADNALDMTVEQFNKHVEVTLGEESSRFDITFNYDDPQMAYDISRDLVDRFILNMRVTFKLHALHDFEDDFTTKIINATKQIELKENVLKGLQNIQTSVDPSYTLQKLLASDPVTAAAIAESMGLETAQLADEIMVEEFANENYFTVEAQILQAEMTLVQLREELADNERSKAEIEEKLSAYESQKESGELTAFLEDDMRVLSQNLMIASPPIFPTTQTGTGKALVLAIGGVLGVMCGVFAGLFAQYWKSN